MLFKNIPIRKKLWRSIILINGILLLVTCGTFFIYELYVFRERMADKIYTIGKIIAVNSTAALAFDNAGDAVEILSAVKTEKHIVAACLYDKNGRLFARYPDTLLLASFPATPGAMGTVFSKTHLELFEPVAQEGRIQGTLYLRSDLGTMYDRFRLYGIITGAIVLISLVLAYLLSEILQKNISVPILALANTARQIAGRQDYSVRVVKAGNDELGELTDSFNGMLRQIEDQNQHLSKFNQELEEKVQDRTNQLETVNKELEAFSYSVSHDLRAPLRSIAGFTSILEEDYISKLDNEAKRLISRIKSNTIKMGNLIDDLLGFSRMARMDVEKKMLETNALVEDIIAELGGRQQDIGWDLSPLPPSNADIRILRQVWINLISNAIKYSRNNPAPRIEIGSTTDGEEVIFFVKDNGVGFDAKYKDKLFKVFQRLHSASEFEGTGVGLAIVEKVISKHGGRVWADAEKNIGATFYFSLPIY